MIGKVRKTLREYGMIEYGDRVVVAVSGGPDSVALLVALDILSSELNFVLIVAHLNHGLRREANEEALFVDHLASTLGHPCEVDCADVSEYSRESGKSIEDAAREIRYAFLNRVAWKYCADKIALGHHRQDQAETVLMNMIRGSGPEGLKGMLPMRERKYIRPLLFIDKDEIMDFLHERNMSYATDSSNDSILYLRNRVRHELLPTLREDFNARMDAGLSQMAEVMRLEDECMDQWVDKTIDRWGVSLQGESALLEINDWLELHGALQNRIIKKVLLSFCPEKKGISFAHVMAVRNLMLQGNPAGRISLPYGLRAKREYRSLIISRAEPSHQEKSAGDTVPEFCYIPEIPGETYIAETGMTIKLSLGNQDINNPETFGLRHDIAFMDYDKIILPLTIRSFRAGDRIQPIGMAGNKKIKSYFIDAKIPRFKRKDVPLLVDSQSVLWIGGWRLSEVVRITSETRRILKAEIH